MKILVCGGRDFYQRPPVFDRLDELQPTHVITGGAPGADDSAMLWACERCVPYTIFPADWSKHGKTAGPIRNKRMLDEGKPDLVLAFPGGVGTMNMVSQALKAGVKVQHVTQ